MMKGKRAFLRKFQALLLASSLTLSMCSATVYAEPDDAAVVTESEGYVEAPETEQQNPAEDYDTGMDGTGSEEGEEITTDSEEPEEDAEDEKEVTEDGEETETEKAKEEDRDFEETGAFGIETEDANGATVKAWYDSSSDRYYLFLTNAIQISEMQMKVTGIRMEKTSRGTLDMTTNTVTGAFANSGDGVTLTAKDGKKYNVIVEQSGIPSLSITLNTTDLATLNGGSKTIKYEGQSVLLTDEAGNVNVKQDDVEIKGRGNTTWVYSDKKPYQIKFSKKQSVLGMAKAKKWILLANSFDDDMLRNKVGFYAGDAIGMPFTPDTQYVDLWIDGEYRGTYTIGEKVEVDQNRVNLTDPLGALCELDVFYAQEDYYFHDDYMNVYYSLADTVDENNSQAAMDHFHNSLSAFEQYLFNTDPSRVTLASLGKYISVDDFAKWLLANEYLCNCESYNTSWYWYKDGPGDVIHLGPLWDFDMSQNMESNKNNHTYTVMYGISFQKMMRSLMAVPAFATRMQQLYKQYRGVFSSLSGMVRTWGAELSTAANINYIRWKYLGRANQKPSGAPFAGSYAAAVDSHANWLAGRDGGFQINVSPVPTAKASVSVSDSGRVLDIKATSITGTSSIRAAVWSNTNSQDDLKWYDLKKNSDGSMSTQVDLANHGSSDTYHIHLYSGNTFLAAKSITVTMQETKPEITAEYDEATGLIGVTMKGVADYTTLNTAIWTNVKGQDDLVWTKTSVKGKDEVTYTIDRASLIGDGPTSIHVYGILASKQSFVTKTEIDLTETLQPEVTAVQTDESTMIDISAKNLAGYSKVKAAVWGSVSGQNDLKWYDLTKQADGSWTASVDFTAHKETGLFHVHVYGTKDGKSQFAAKTTVETVKPVEPSVTVKTVEENSKYKATIKNVSACTSVSFAVWGDKNSQNDLKWYTGKKNADGTWSADILIQNHLETGRYNVHVYGMRAGKNTFLAATSFTVDSIGGMELNAVLSPTQRVVTATLENALPYSSVSIAIWGNANGQNDLKWYPAKKNLDGSWTTTVDLTKHNETGVYALHAYGVLNGKNTFAASTSLTVTAYAKPVVTAEDRGISFQTKAANTDDYDSVRFAVWTADNGQDDLKWYNGTRYYDGGYRANVKYAMHGGNGVYNIHAYGTKNGKDTFIGAYILIKKDLEDAKLTVALSEDKTQLLISTTNPVGYSVVSAAVWGSTGGQNDLKWYTLSKDSEGLYSATVKLSAHNEKGTFNIHVYGKEGKASFMMNHGNIQVP